MQGQTERCGPAGAAGFGLCRSLECFVETDPLPPLPPLWRILWLQASVLHAAAALLRRPPNEAAAVEMVIQAAEAAVRGALQFKSAQLLVGALVIHLCPADSGWSRMTFNPLHPIADPAHKECNANGQPPLQFSLVCLQNASLALLAVCVGAPDPHHRREVAGHLLQEGSEAWALMLLQKPDSRILPPASIKQLIAVGGGTMWWSAVPLCDWARPESEHVESSDRQAA